MRADAIAYFLMSDEMESNVFVAAMRSDAFGYATALRPHDQPLGRNDIRCSALEEAMSSMGKAISSSRRLVEVNSPTS